MRWIFSLYFFPLLLTLKGQITHVPNFPTIPIHDLHTHGNDSLFIGTDQGLYLWQHSSSVLDSFPEQFNTFIGATLDIQNDLLLAQFPNQIHSLANSVSPFSINYPEEVLVMDMAFDSITQMLWIATYNDGLFSIHTKTGRNRHYLLDSTEITNINAIELDHNGTLWIGTEMGVYKKSRTPSQAPFLSISESNIPISSRSRITQILSTKNQVWFAGIDTLWRLMDGNRWDIITFPLAIEIGKIEDIILDDEGILWLAGAKLVRYDELTQYWTQYGEEQGLTSQHILSLAVDQRDRLWIGTEGKGLFTVSLSQLASPPVEGVSPVLDGPHDEDVPVSRGLTLPNKLASHTIFLMDISASMKKIWNNALFSSFLAAIQQLQDPSDVFSLISYANTSQVVQLTTTVDSLRTNIRTWDDYKFGGKTKLFKGLKKTYQLFHRDKRFAEQYILLITDGSYLRRKKVKKLVQKRGSSHIPLYIVSFGPLGERVVGRLTTLAELGKGQFYHIKGEENMRNWISFFGD